MAEKVELHFAYVWDCAECGRENFTRGVTLEMSGDDEQELREDYGIEPHEQGDWMLAPDNVTCVHCNAEFETVHPHQEETDE